MSRADPLRGTKVVYRRQKLVGAHLLKAAIDETIRLAQHEHVGGHRHYGGELATWEWEHHQQVDRKLKDILRRTP
jgi:hypothetical protein